MENDLQEHVAEFLLHRVVVARLNGVEQFIHFLDRVEAQRQVILLMVPRAAARAAQAGHDVQEVFDGGALLRAHGWSL